jgi:hypothetical protein
MPEEITSTETTQTAETSVVNTDGSFAENWSEKYGTENQAHLSRYKDFDSLVNSHINTKKKLGKDPNTLVEIPNENSSDEVRAAFRKANGVPDNVDAYEYTLSDELAVKLGPLDDNRMAKIRQFAHEELGLSAAKFTKLLDFYHNDLSEGIDEFGATTEAQRTADAIAGKAELRKLPGWQSDEEYNAKVQRAQMVMEKYDFLDFVAENNLQNSPKLLIALNKVADSMSEDTLKGLKAAPGLSADNINSQIADLRSQQDEIRKENPINFKSDPKFKNIETRLKGLYQQKPKKPA